MHTLVFSFLFLFFICIYFSHVFASALLLVNAVVTMSEFLELPNWDGTDVVEGSPIPDGQTCPVRTVEPLPEGQNPPQKRA